MRAFAVLCGLSIAIGCGGSTHDGDDLDGSMAADAPLPPDASFLADAPPPACDDGGCVPCQPGTTVCLDGNVHACEDNGTVGAETMACTGFNVCEGGSCVDACALAAIDRGYQGCEFMAVDLDNTIDVIAVQGDLSCQGTPGVTNVTMLACGNASSTAVQGLCDPPNNACPVGTTCKPMNVCIRDAQHAPFAIVVSNPQTRAVSVTMTGPGGQTIMQSVAAGAIAVFEPQAPPGSMPDTSVDGSGLAGQAYKVTAEMPIAAYQFNPLDDANLFSSDASLLIPLHAYDIEYYVIGWPTESRRPQTHDSHGYFSVVAAEDDTIVEVTTTAATIASATQPAIAANTPTMFTLAAFDVLTLQAVSGGDLTGTRVRSLNGTAFGVFGGHEAMVFGEMNPPDGSNTFGPCCSSHLEEMLLPTSTWGTTFAITRSQPRGTNEPDLVRVMAQSPNTSVTFDPAPTGICSMLQPGQFCEVRIFGDTSITATGPILVAHYLESAIWQDPLFGSSVGEGGPSLAISVPVEQYRAGYTVLVPTAFPKNYLSMSATASGSLVVDGVVVTLTPYGNGTYGAARMQVNPGPHTITCPGTCGVEVHGYTGTASYMFAGGLALKRIVP
jgi:hypothetical protein